MYNVERVDAMALVYKENPKHKPGSFGEGPPRWFPDRDTPCPDDITGIDAKDLLDKSLPGKDPAHPDAKARYAIDDRGRFFKGYSEATVGNDEIWHGYPVREEKVSDQIPARVLRQFKELKILSKARYKKLLGRAR